MLGLLAEMPVVLLIATFAVALLAGFVKGAVGFALPMIMISGLGSFLPPDVALAALILPAFVTNAVQSLRDGLGAAWGVVQRFRIYLGTMLVMLVLSAQLVNVISDAALFLCIGIPMIGFALFQLAGGRIRLNPETRRRDEALFGTFSGAIGGMSGVWGPPLVAYLVSIDAEKRLAIRAQGVIYGVGAMAMVVAHLHSGVLNRETLPLSAAVILPALAGLWLGGILHDRMPQAQFRRAMLVVLVIAGLNLVRRGLGW